MMDRLEFKLFDAVAAGEPWAQWESAVGPEIPVAGIYINGRELGEIVKELERRTDPQAQGYGHRKPRQLRDALTVYCDPDERYRDWREYLHRQGVELFCCLQCGLPECGSPTVRPRRVGSRVIWTLGHNRPDKARDYEGLTFTFDAGQYREALEQLRSMAEGGERRA